MSPLSVLAPSPAAPRRRPARGASHRALVLLLAAALLAVVALPGHARADGPRWRWPLPPPHHVISPFQAPEHPYGPGHRGIDISVPVDGDAVRAVESGTVRFSGMVAGRGVVSVVHADGLISTYQPVHGLLDEGSPVQAGEVLGTLARTSGASHCPGSGCLHLGARRDGRYLDPLPLLGGRGPSVLLPWEESSGAEGTPVAAAAPSPSAEARAIGPLLVAAAPSRGDPGRSLPAARIR
ncbi:metalloendopeptidase [Brachybacterium avium]|uniref:Metalloendopeptidase n=2 Tax=Brachybacterium avium TaxID=2017485 RepID=A0A220UER0_9MICO|nr:metalloendopeptidase [Brachybacterium avium]